jgi:hypothetical protein
MYKNQILTLEDAMKFGKHIGETIEQIANDNPTYIEWMIENIENIAFSEDVISELDLSDEAIETNLEKMNRFLDESLYERHDSYIDHDQQESHSIMEDNWYAMTDGMYGDMPDGFDGDYSFLGY